MTYTNLSQNEWENEYKKVKDEFNLWRAKKLSLNMARGKPSKAQLDMVSDILGILTDPNDCVDGTLDVRNYGEIMGIPSARIMFADILGCRPEQVYVGGNASLQLMYDTVAKAYTHGLLHSPRPWCREEKIQWLCPVPGYDRHFKITESFGFELISMPMTESGPDMDLVERLITNPEVKGMWNVPKYSNPDGIIYSDTVIQRLASMKPAAPDFLLMWDNAYCIHEFEGDFVPFQDILELCKQAGNEDMVFEFASTSKITLPGSGIACFACSEANMKYITSLMDAQVISFDKVNQLRHVKYLKNKAHALEIMKRHAEIMAPKFQTVLHVLSQEVGNLGIATWHKPKGGYFISLNTAPGLAKRTLALCQQAGVTMTAAGATYPYGEDPQDSNIRIAPSLPPITELEQAMRVFCCCLKLAALEAQHSKTT